MARAIDSSTDSSIDSYIEGQMEDSENTGARHRCLVVLGMHRSGTSCLTGMVEQCGVNLGEVFTKNPFNQKGNRESASIQAINNAVLEQNGGAWNQPVLATDWGASLRRDRDTILNELIPQDGGWWGFKDPRVVFTLPFWIEATGDPHFIATFRHPHRVALSLNQRDGLALKDGFELWRQYNVQLLRWITEFEIPLVDFDLNDENYRRDVASKLGRVGLSGADSETFFDASLRHQSSVELDHASLPEHILDVYRELKARHHA
ncbi:MAG: hypothetical protein ACI8Z1_000475 [Candidatus Azotimanducaceae bacterium]|jgi:hypothetical protein